MVELQVGDMDARWLAVQSWKEKEWLNERECESALSHLYIMFLNTLNSGKIGLDMHEHMHPDALPMQ